ncbi:hypothetical protein SFRURICE_017177, partial [Spodoptera frugiperda]
MKMMTTMGPNVQLWETKPVLKKPTEDKLGLQEDFASFTTMFFGYEFYVK